VPRSIQVRLVRHAVEHQADPNRIFVRYATERLLYRLSQSAHAESFVLKGGMLLLVWLGETLRPTRDADLLWAKSLSADSLSDIFRAACRMDIAGDGLEFDEQSVRVETIREDNPDGGQRVSLWSRLGAARLSLTVDVAAGDAVWPEPEWIEYPSLLDLPRPRLRAYRPETAIAEKFHAMVLLELRNSRMRDFFDIHALASRESFDGRVLAAALALTFERRRTPLPESVPVALTSDFARDSTKRLQWAGFIRRNRLRAAPEDLEQVVLLLSEFLRPIVEALVAKQSFRESWPPGGPWTRSA